MKTHTILSIALSSALLFVLVFLSALNSTLGESLKPMQPSECPVSDNYIPGNEDASKREKLDSFHKIARMEENMCLARMKATSIKVTTRSHDGLALHALLGEQRGSSKYIIFMHGYRSSPKAGGPYAMHFYDKGWNYLVPGQRGHGWSGGSFIDMGSFARFDVVQWVNYIKQRNPNARIILYGVSMGAATVMMSEELLSSEPAVLCAVEDCGFTSFHDQIREKMKLMHIPEFPGIHIVDTMVKSHYKFDPVTVSPIKAIGRSSMPTLFIHGDQDVFVPFPMQEKLFEAASCPKEKLVIEGATHAVSAYANPELYWNTVDDFIRRHAE